MSVRQIANKLGIIIKINSTCVKFLLKLKKKLFHINLWLFYNEFIPKANTYLRYVPTKLILSCMTWSLSSIRSNLSVVIYWYSFNIWYLNREIDKIYLIIISKAFITSHFSMNVVSLSTFFFQAKGWKHLGSIKESTGKNSFIKFYFSSLPKYFPFIQWNSNLFNSFQLIIIYFSHLFEPKLK